MILSSQTNYPSTRSYVLKLHRDATPQGGQIVGRLENMASGHHFYFRTGDELLACLARDAAAYSPPPSPIEGEGDLIRKAPSTLVGEGWGEGKK
jgi:hypothetical protein